MISCCCLPLTIIRVIDVLLLAIVTVSAGFVIFTLSPSVTAAYASQLGSGTFAVLSLGLTVLAMMTDVGRSVTWALGACTAGCGAFWLWLCINGKEDLVCTGYPFMASACSLSGMKYLFWAIYIISFIAQILVFFIVKLGDIPCLNFGGRGKSRSMGKTSRRRGRSGQDEEGEAMGLQRAWNSDSSQQESDSDAHKQRTMSGKGRGDGDESAGRKSLGLGDEDLSGEGGSGRRSSMRRY